MVATNALGMGVDIPDIEWIIHADEPRDMLDYAQESGRAGRDGRASHAILVTGYDDEVDSLVQAYISGEGSCRRKIPSSYLDGEADHGRCRFDEESCDLCRPHEISFEYAGSQDRQVVEAQRRRAGSDKGDMAERLEEQFSTQQRQAAAVRMRRTKERVVEAGVEERLERQLWKWKGKCIHVANVEYHKACAIDTGRMGRVDMKGSTDSVNGMASWHHGINGVWIASRIQGIVDNMDGAVGTGWRRQGVREGR
ncbi:uncharacterized protein PV09_09493 [Verruconis gallopava]|uniref:DNA 3'-5' helicase n=1 Tax=Verruconis gallopava TaxID=253628 RepID=A0A0D1YDD2_9PEZI|nr:uncharacterized protein PV09_09493 [Verruconis gallopava]KIV98741.1 hypothetical protein PV09_09493 [Verruconis gallopava]